MTQMASGSVRVSHQSSGSRLSNVALRQLPPVRTSSHTYEFGIYWRSIEDSLKVASISVEVVDFGSPAYC